MSLRLLILSFLDLSFLARYIRLVLSLTQPLTLSFLMRPFLFDVVFLQQVGLPRQRIRQYLPRVNEVLDSGWTVTTELENYLKEISKTQRVLFHFYVLLLVDLIGHLVEHDYIDTETIKKSHGISILQHLPEFNHVNRPVIVLVC